MNGLAIAAASIDCTASSTGDDSAILMKHSVCAAACYDKPEEPPDVEENDFDRHIQRCVEQEFFEGVARVRSRNHKPIVRGCWQVRR